MAPFCRTQQGMSSSVEANDTPKSNGLRRSRSEDASDAFPAVTCYLRVMRLLEDLRIALLVGSTAFVACVACGGSQTAPAAPSFAADPTTTPGASEDAPRPSITAAACEANHGAVVGDIGDGAIHRPEYRCINGAKPTANISPAAGGPIAIEGSVCCPR